MVEKFNENSIMLSLIAALKSVLLNLQVTKKGTFFYILWWPGKEVARFVLASCIQVSEPSEQSKATSNSKTSRKHNWI